MLRAVIIDDEKAGIETLKMLALRNSSTIRIVAFALKAAEGITLIEDYKPDIVFLDINMPGMDGFELLGRLGFRDFKLVFTTAHREYAIRAIKNQAYDYLLKPIADEEFRKCINRMAAEQEKNTAPHRDPQPIVELQVKDGIVYLRQKDIVRLQASRSYTEFYMDNGIKHVASRSMIDFENRLDMGIFYRCHKSHIVNLQKVQKFVNHGGFYALMCDGSMPDVSKAFKDEFLLRLNAL